VKDLSALFRPASVAIVGASADPAKWGNSVARQALRSDRRPVHLVNRSGGRILGRTAARSLADVGEPVDLAVLAVPVAGFDEALDAALAAGARAVVGITAGFAEAGPAGADHQRAIVERVRRARALLLGPNCLGLVDTEAELYLSSDPFRPGTVALISQSGNLALELDQRLGRLGLGFSRFVSLGNQADVSLVDVLDDCASDPGTGAIAVYAEDFADGRGFAEAAARAVEVHGTPVVVLAAGRSIASARGAASHTGALTSGADVVAAACRDAGAHLARTPREMATLLAALRSGRTAAGRRTAILTDGGGHGAIAADAAERAGLTVPELSPAVRDRLRAVLWPQSATANPVDLAGIGEQDPAAYAAALAILLAADEVDAVLMTGYFGGYAGSGEDFGPDLARGETAAGRDLAAHIEAAGKPVAVQSLYPDSPSCAPIAAAGVPVLDAIEDAATALGCLGGTGAAPGVPALPEPADPIRDTGYLACRRLLAGAGVEFPAAYGATDEASVRTAVAAIGAGPYVLKALAGEHKSDGGGVALGLPDEAAVLAAHATMTAGHFSVETMAATRDGIELIVGVRRDPKFGPVAMVGFGGVHTEVLRDVAFALAPVPADRALDLLRGLRSAPLLTGHRGRPPVDLDAAARAIAAITRCAAAHPELAALEVNPLLVAPAGAVALDARAHLTTFEEKR